MGAAISAFGERAAALVVPRGRFSPVKACADLLALRCAPLTACCLLLAAAAAAARERRAASFNAGGSPFPSPKGLRAALTHASSAINSHMDTLHSPPQPGSPARSDCYELRPDGSLSLSPYRISPAPPVVSLDARYKAVDAFETAVPRGAPSLLHCARLKVRRRGGAGSRGPCRGTLGRSGLSAHQVANTKPPLTPTPTLPLTPQVVGPVVFAPGVVLRGSVEVVNEDADGPAKTLPAGTYEDTTVRL